MGGIIYWAASKDYEPECFILMCFVHLITTDLLHLCFQTGRQ